MEDLNTLYYFTQVVEHRGLPPQDGPMLTRSMLKYPLVERFIQSTNRRVDLIHQGFDIALRVRFAPLENTDLVIKVLGNSTQCLMDHADFLQHLSSPADLSGLPSVHWGRLASTGARRRTDPRQPSRGRRSGRRQR